MESAPLPSDTLRVQHVDARHFACDVFVAAGFPATDAELVADVLVANHADLCSEAELAAFDSWADALWPRPLATLHTSHGEVPIEHMAWPDGEGLHA